MKASQNQIESANTNPGATSEFLALLESGNELRIRLRGQLNLDNHSNLRELLEEVLNRTDQPLIILDMSGVSSIASSAFGALVDFARRSFLKQRTLILDNLSPDCERVLDLLRLRPLFNVNQN